MSKQYQQFIKCPVEKTLSVIGGRWKVVIIFHLQENKIMRFNEMQRSIKGITQRMLTSQLRELETDGIINRKIYPQVPPRVEYSLTEYGKTLEPILTSMEKWGEIHLSRSVIE